ncbi:MAG: DUF695 domain-containing protein [Bacteroidales bacterium]|jgi:hypothetical protein|nr:DUF695 domain-containing protein [Bacteroidales bacterium]
MKSKPDNKNDELNDRYEKFWRWFQENEKEFFFTVKQSSNIEERFFDQLSPKLGEIKDGFFFLAGMLGDDIAELVFTADGNIADMVYIEELVNTAPDIAGWKFTAHKPPIDIEKFNIRMGNYEFSKNNLFFYSNDHDEYPDEIDISVIYTDFNEADQSSIVNGVYIFLDNYLGELKSVTVIDNLLVVGPDEAQKELIPIGKLNDFLTWREKEFVEKYDGERHNTENDSYSSLEATLENGKPLIAIVNSTLLAWDHKASHPWILRIEMKYDGEENNGMPDKPTYQLLDKIEDEIMSEMHDVDGYLNVGRETADSVREVYFACKDFRKPSKVMYQLVEKYTDEIDISFEIYKDKYWQTFQRFMVD